MEASREEHGFLHISTRRLYVAYHSLTGKPTGAALFCLPIHEEQKSAYRPVVDAARALAGRGCASLRFHYCGTGDSSGDPLDLSVESMIRDILDAAEHLCERSGVRDVALVGLRLGAALALVAAEQCESLAGLMLIEPVQSGRTYISRVLTRKRVRRMVTAAEGGQQSGAGELSEEEAMGDDVLDYDGHAISSALRSGLESLELCERSGTISVPVLLLEVAPKERISNLAMELAQSLEQRGANVNARVIVAEPFWNSLGVVCVPALTQAIVDFVMLASEGVSTCTT